MRWIWASAKGEHQARTFTGRSGRKTLRRARTSCTRRWDAKVEIFLCKQLVLILGKQLVFVDP